MNKRRFKVTELYGLLKTSLKYQTKEFFDNSTLHGVRYIAEKGRSFGEKFMWFCFVAIGAVAAFVIIGSLWEKFQTNPTITGLDTDFHNQQVLFPTVTVCSLVAHNPVAVNQASRTFVAGNDDNFDEYISVLKTLPELTYPTLSNTYEAILNMSDESNAKTRDLRELAFKVAIKCDELFSLCKYKDEEISCCDSFLPLYTENGFCYSFNARYFGTPATESRNDKINDLYETDKKWALKFVLTTSSKIYLHSIDEVSGHDFRPTFTWETGHSIDLLITMKQTYTTDDAKQLSIGQRKCIFPDEVKLEYYKNDEYSFSSCMKQCRMKKANRFCQCIPAFYAPSAAGKYRQCFFDDFACLLKYRANITDIRGCRQCELSCLNTVYDIEKFTKSMIADNKPEDTHVTIEFLTWPIIRYKREVLFGWVDLLVSFGGIAGLFLGFSLLSGVELIYYFTMRAGCMIYRNREDLYAIQTEKESRPVSQYDLSLKPKLKQSDRIKSQSMSNVQTVKPVESAGSSKSNKSIQQVKAFNSPKAPIKNQIPTSFASNKTRIEDLAVHQQQSQKSQKKQQQQYNQSHNHHHDKNNGGARKRHLLPAPPRQNIFRPIHVAPYSTHIKPLDRKFRFRSQSEGPDADVMFDGYLP